MACLGLLHQVFGPSQLRTSYQEASEAKGRADLVKRADSILQRGRQAAEDGVLSGAAEEAASRVLRQPISHGGEEAAPLCRARPLREPAEDLVPEQESQAEEGDG